MYESFYGLNEKPFSTLPDPEFLFMSKKHEMALTYLEYGLSSQAGFMVLTGEVGSGKTTLINHLTNQADEKKTRLALIYNTNIKPNDFIDAILKEWGLNAKSRRKAEQYELLNSFLIDAYSHKTSVILIVDEAQNLPFETLEEIRMISNLNDEKVPLLHIILSGQPNLITRLNDPKLEQLLQRVSVHYHLESLSGEETHAYIQHRLNQANSRQPDLFSPEALQAVVQHSGGIPRVINLICDMALVYGFAERLSTLDRTIIEQVVNDRTKMGLGFGGNVMLADNVTAARARTPSSEGPAFDRKFKELNENVYELALLVRKMIRIKEHIDTVEQDHGQKIEMLQQKIENLENSLLVSPVQKGFHNFMRRLTNAEIDK
ncbi:MAG: AAA family ATPase [Deltaproteobacteria bacterium]|nr:AAA family ATPase [Deltaproteobacteria bacterium]